MKRVAAVLLVFAVFFSLSVIPLSASEVRGYVACETEERGRVLTDCQSRANGSLLSVNTLSDNFYELRITLKRSIIFANIAN